MQKLTPANEDYLEAIFELCDSGIRSCRSVEVANKLEVSKASVNQAVNALKQAGFIEQQRYGEITLTDEGRAYGGDVLSRHHSLYTFLHDMLGVDAETAEEEACAMEHTISADTMRRWNKFVALNSDAG